MDGEGDLADVGEVQGDDMVAGRESAHEGFKEDYEEDAGVLVNHLKILVIFGDQVPVKVDIQQGCGRGAHKDIKTGVFGRMINPVCGRMDNPIFFDHAGFHFCKIISCGFHALFLLGRDLRGLRRIDRCNGSWHRIIVINDRIISERGRSRFGGVAGAEGS